MSGPVATIHASAPRRYVAIAMLAALGALLIWLGIARPPASIGLQLFLVGLGIVVLLLVEKFRRATQYRIELDGDALRDSSGAMLCRVEDIVRLDRGAFAFKPSNGFLIVLNQRGSRHWSPGMWWRVGRRIGVGGVTPGPQTKIMAELLATRVAARNEA
ncbi:MAG: hypothetical protein ACWA47_02435 [Brevirhabdus sp.]